MKSVRSSWPGKPHIDTTEGQLLHGGPGLGVQFGAVAVPNQKIQGLLTLCWLPGTSHCTRTLTAQDASSGLHVGLLGEISYKGPSSTPGWPQGVPAKLQITL